MATIEVATVADIQVVRVIATAAGVVSLDLVAVLTAALATLALAGRGEPHPWRIVGTGQYIMTG